MNASTMRRDLQSTATPTNSEVNIQPTLTTLPTVTAATTDLVSSTAHGLAADDLVIFTALTGGAGLAINTRYFVIADGLTANVFKLSATRRGAAIDITTAATAATAIGAKCRVNSVSLTNVKEDQAATDSLVVLAN